MYFTEFPLLSNVIGRWVLHEKKGWDRGRWVGASKGVNSILLCPGISSRKALVGPVLAVSLLLCMSGLRRQSFHLVGHPFSGIECS